MIIHNQRELITISARPTVESVMEFKLKFVALLVLSVGTLLQPTTSQADDAAILLPRVLNATEQTCPPDELLNTALMELNQDIRTLLHNNVICPAAQMAASPAASCSEISADCPSGYYWVRSSNGTAVQVYCDMDRVCGCNSTGGWTRIANLDVRNTSQQCPSAWALITTPTRVCGRTTSSAGCDSAIFPTNGIRYSHICGRIIGYQYGSPDGFYDSDPSLTIDYVDGVSVTHGTSGSRQHIWSFAAGVRQDENHDNAYDNCPCSGGPSPLCMLDRTTFVKLAMIVI